MEGHDVIVQNLRDKLETEFCPPLDTSLFAAVFGEFEYSPEGVADLRDMLSELAAGAFAEGPPATTSQIPSGSGIDSSSDSMLPSANTSSSGLMGSPIAFLRSAFPELPVQVLQDAVDNVSHKKTAFNMEEIVEELLSSELLARLDSDGIDPVAAEENGEWRIAAPRTSTQKKAKSTRKGERIVMGDVRQRQLMASRSERGRAEQLDPWTQLSSIADYLSTILHCPASVFLSVFHSPYHPTAFHAVASYIDSAPLSGLAEESVDQYLISMAEIMSTADTEEWDAQWARKCIHATKANLSEAIDLYKILMSLEDIGPINHLPAPARSPRSSTPSTPIILPSPKLPVPTSGGPRPCVNKYPAPKPDNASEWQIVKKRTPKSSELHPHAEFIPAYRNFKAVPAWTVHKATDEAMRNRSLEQSWQDRRIAALRKASQHWQRSQGGFGPQVAGYYAEEANKYLRESREAAIEAARALVLRSRAQSRNMGYNTHNAIDLHGMRREEALVIVKEELAARAALKDASKREEPLRFITGKGNHSAGNQSILLPALQKALKSEGWTFREIEAGIVVYGRR